MSKGQISVAQATVLLGNAIDRLKELPDASAQTCITSPPYYQLRDYQSTEQIGLERTPEDYIERLVAVFREVRRVLADNGTLWLNLGDTYTRNKELMGIPWRVALALQSDGWVLRQDIIWHKTNAMPESVKDRCTQAHEYLFLLTKSKHYFFDHEAMKEPAVGASKGQGERNRAQSFKREQSKRAQVIPRQRIGSHRPDRPESAWDTELRNRRSVWPVATRAYQGAHVAVFPPELIEPCLLAGSQKGDLVLDPFNGSGTTGEVALLFDRHYIGIEINPDYLELSHERLLAAFEQWERSKEPDPQLDLFSAETEDSVAI